MKTFTLMFLKLVVLIVVALLCYSCAKWDRNNIKIERFEYLDESPFLEAYLISGYTKKYDDRIQRIVDSFICHSILGNNTPYHAKYITFFKETKNTNRDNFQTRRKHKIIRSQTKDKLFSYRFTTKDSMIFRITKIYQEYDTEVSFQGFHCNWDE